MAGKPFSIKAGLPQRLVAFKLDDVKWANCVVKPAVWMGFVSKASNDIADLISLKRRSGDTGQAFRSVMADFSEIDLSVRSKKESIEAREDLGRRLAERGYSVNTELDTLHLIYVIELSSNPFSEDDRLAVYVGQTSHTADERLLEHLAGKNSARTSKLMTTRREDLEPGQSYSSHSVYNAEVLESAWGRELEARGFRVFGPNGFSKSKKRRAASS
jgi:hypothetical protein